MQCRGLLKTEGQSSFRKSKGGLLGVSLLKKLMVGYVLHVGLVFSGCEDKPAPSSEVISKLAVNQLVLTDSKGQQRAWLGLEEISLPPSFRQSGRIRLGIGLDLDGSPKLDSPIWRIPVLNLAMDQEGNMGLLIVNEDGTPRVVTGVGADGRPAPTSTAKTVFAYFRPD